jgi:hypothetical protein
MHPDLSLLTQDLGVDAVDLSYDDIIVLVVFLLMGTSRKENQQEAYRNEFHNLFICLGNLTKTAGRW